ncbi:ABC transporter ATP-binding protein [Citrobacter koseri]|uniref:ABC transporter ATP-binding protein n=1 Tax=Citrobacter koseri TaxID=545 RepID=UPI0038914986
MSQLVLERLEKTQQGQTILQDINLQVEQGEFIVFVGPSGCGKTTLLRMLAGLEALSAGRILLRGCDVSQASPVDRQVAMVFQSYALYPHLTVYENLAFPLRVARQPPVAIEQAVQAAAHSLRLTPYLQRKPGSLSGGQRQRVAIGRAIVRQPAIFLFDEPLSNLDAALRADMRLEIMRLHRSLGVTTLYVTHDQVEAMTMADRIVVLNQGRIEQIGTPEQLYFQPRNLFVAQFIGHPKINVLPAVCQASGQGVSRIAIPQLDGWSLEVPHPLLVGEPLSLAIRPEHVRFAGQIDAPSVPFNLGAAEWLGNQTVLYGDVAGHPFCCTTSRHVVRQQQDGAFSLTLPTESILLFDAQGERIG